MTTSPVSSLPVAFRTAADGDESYVIKAWLEALRDEYAEMRDSDYYPWMRARIAGMTFMRLAVAHPETQPDVIWGWVAYDHAADPTNAPRIHMLYVRRRYRRLGIAGHLFALATEGHHGPVTVTNLTPDGRAIKRAHPDLLRYVPL